MGLTTSSTQQQLIDDLHRQLMILKISHYHWKSFARHSAFGRLYDALNELGDTITEQLIGYSSSYPSQLVLGTVQATAPETVAKSLKDLGSRLEKYGEEKEYCNIENLGQELSGLGAQLAFLSVYP